MILTGKEDLRVQKTIEAIHSGFEQLICQKDYEKITVKELCSLAKISKKTFYVYYDDLNDLLFEMQSQLSSQYVERISNFKLPQDAASVIEEFFRFSNDQTRAYEKITSSENFQYIRGQMIRNVQEETEIDDFINSLPGYFMSTSLLEIYKYWIKNGKKESLEEIITSAKNLILKGLDSSI